MAVNYQYSSTQTPDGRALRFGTVCFCAAHCSNTCEPAHCSDAGWCDCWCHAGLWRGRDAERPVITCNAQHPKYPQVTCVATVYSPEDCLDEHIGFMGPMGGRRQVRFSTKTEDGSIPNDKY